MERKTFKEKWNETDEVCPHCGQVTKVNRGLTKQNINKLFRKPTIQDWIILIMIALTLFGAWNYQNELKIHKELITIKVCADYEQKIIYENIPDFNISNIPNIELIENEEVK